MARQPHKTAHAPCPNHETTWYGCDLAAKEARGRCVAMTEKAEECTNWAIEEHDGKGYCGQHYGREVNLEIARKRAEVRRAALDQRITDYLAWRADNPSVWEEMAGGAGLEPAITRVTTEGPTTERPTNVPWRASSGLPFTRT